MNRELPAFAKALKRRHQPLTNRKNVGSQNSPVSSRPRQSLPSRRTSVFEDEDERPIGSRDSSDLTEDTEDCDHQTLSAIQIVEPSFRTNIAECQRRLRELQHENRNLLQMNRYMMGELADLKADSFTFTHMTGKLFARQRAVDELSQLIQSKDAEIACLCQSRTKLESDYKRMLDLRSLDAEAISSKQLEISRITREIESLRSGARVVDDPRCSLRGAVDNPPVGRVQAVPSAMKDNVYFGDDGKAASEMTVGQMSDAELRARLQALTKEKEEKEWLLSRAPPKGANSAHVRRQKEQLDEDVAALDRVLSKIRLEMKRRQIY
jgi:hypothetical protein